jgi:hypothetical protein
MWRMLLLTFSLAACDAVSGNAVEVGDAPVRQPPFDPADHAETPGPTCREVAAHLTASLSKSTAAMTSVEGKSLSVDVPMAQIAFDSLVQRCLEDQWNEAAKNCLLGQKGSFLKDMKRWRSECSLEVRR